MTRLMILSTLLAGAAFAASPALAQSAPAASAPHGLLNEGAPRFDLGGGWTLKPRGRIQLDTGSVDSPPGTNDPLLGSGSEVRRARIGVEGDAPGHFGYKFEIDVAPDVVEIQDAQISYSGIPHFEIVAGQQNPFQSLEELTSSRFTSFIERAAFTDAFGFERQLGVSGTYASGPLRVSAGLFTDNLIDLHDDGEMMSADARIVYSPVVSGTQLHFGGSVHVRDIENLSDNNVTTRYRQRPLVHFTSRRLIGTPAMAVQGETSYGLEAAAIHGRFHAAGEAYWLRADRVAPAADPTFFGGYAEIGMFLTHDSRGYRKGQFDRTRPSHPLGHGGIGAVQVNLRYDHLDLNDAGVVGGQQHGYQASLIWTPVAHLRFQVNYARMDYSDAIVPAANGSRDYSVDVFGARAEFDF